MTNTWILTTDERIANLVEAAAAIGGTTTVIAVAPSAPAVGGVDTIIHVLLTFTNIFICTHIKSTAFLRCS